MIIAHLRWGTMLWSGTTKILAEPTLFSQCITMGQLMHCKGSL